jgi:predicted phosphodiesterase
MKIQYFSDIHLNYYSHVDLTQINIDCDVLVIAGDIGNPTQLIYKQFLQYVHSKCPKVFIITGNHEYYNHGMTIEQTNEHIKFLTSDCPNITFLNNSFEDYNGVRFVGSVLWCTPTNNDYISHPQRQIKNTSFVEFNQNHQTCKQFLQNTFELSISQQMPIVVITHYLPSYKLISPQFKSNPITMWFASNSDELINPYIKYWIYGHTHQPNHSIINGVSFHCNPVGYPNENTTTNYEMFIDV